MSIGKRHQENWRLQYPDMPEFKNKEKKRDEKGQIVRSIKNEGELLYLFQRYIDWCGSNPIIENVPIQRTGTVLPVERERPLSIIGFSVFLKEVGVCTSFKTDYVYSNAKAEMYADLKPAIEYIKDYCNNFRLDRGLVKIYDASLVARVNGLVDKKEEVVKKKFVIGKKKKD